jgi:hypothetical protein
VRSAAVSLLFTRFDTSDSTVFSAFAVITVSLLIASSENAGKGTAGVSSKSRSGGIIFFDGLFILIIEEYVKKTAMSSMVISLYSGDNRRWPSMNDLPISDTMSKDAYPCYAPKE